MDASKPKVQAKQHDSYRTYTMVAALLPLVGLILGIVYMAKDQKLDKKLGEHLLVTSILFSVIWGLILIYFVSNSVIRANEQRQAQAYSELADALETEYKNVWDVQGAYDKIQNGMTRAEAEKIMAKGAGNCSSTESQYLGKLDSCTYGDVIDDKATIYVQYTDGKVTMKSKHVY